MSSWLPKSHYHFTTPPSAHPVHQSTLNTPLGGGNRKATPWAISIAGSTHRSLTANVFPRYAALTLRGQSKPVRECQLFAPLDVCKTVLSGGLAHIITLSACAGSLHVGMTKNKNRHCSPINFWVAGSSQSTQRQTVLTLPRR